MEKIVIFDGKDYKANYYQNGNIILTPTTKEDILLVRKKLWANRQLLNYSKEYKFIKQGRKTYAIYISERGELHGYNWGLSICNKKDEYNEQIGQALALARAEDISIPDFFYK